MVSTEPNFAKSWIKLHSKSRAGKLNVMLVLKALISEHRRQTFCFRSKQVV